MVDQCLIKPSHKQLAKSMKICNHVILCTISNCYTVLCCQMIVKKCPFVHINIRNYHTETRHTGINRQLHCKPLQTLHGLEFSTPYILLHYFNDLCWTIYSVVLYIYLLQFCIASNTVVSKSNMHVHITLKTRKKWKTHWGRRFQSLIVQLAMI